MYSDAPGVPEGVGCQEADGCLGCAEVLDGLGPGPATVPGGMLDAEVSGLLSSDAFPGLFLAVASPVSISAEICFALILLCMTSDVLVLGYERPQNLKVSQG